MGADTLIETLVAIHTLATLTARVGTTSSPMQGTSHLHQQGFDNARSEDLSGAKCLLTGGLAFFGGPESLTQFRASPGLRALQLAL